MNRLHTLISSTTLDYLGRTRPRRNGNEPLKRFAEAKKAIGDIFGRLETNVKELYAYYCGLFGFFH